MNPDQCTRQNSAWHTVGLSCFEGSQTVWRYQYQLLHCSEHRHADTGVLHEQAAEL